MKKLSIVKPVINKKLYLTLLSVSLITLLTFQSCSKDPAENVASTTSQKMTNAQVASINELLNQYSNNVAPIIRNVETRNAGEMAFTGDEMATLMKALEPLYGESVEILKTFGITDNEIVEICGSEEKYSVILTVLAMAESQYFSECAVTRNEYVNCALAVLGLDLFTSIRTFGEVGAKKVAMKLLKTAATKLLGPVGVALAIAEYGVCVGLS